MSAENSKEQRKLILVNFGQSFTPFADIDLRETLTERVSPKSERFYLDGVGQIKVNMELELGLAYPDPTQVVMEDEKGNPILSDIATELYLINVVVDYDNTNALDGNFMCTLQIGNLNITSRDFEEENPKLAGYAVFMGWRKGPVDPTDMHENLLIPAKYLHTLKVKFDKTANTPS
ncbi:MAG TPA: hypothetical protein VLE44_02260 [Candidatus Saccharimonadales bacterium]|nr:hypothetical protein [Candidatus Saccharimonadales bacterium]